MWPWIFDRHSAHDERDLFIVKEMVTTTEMMEMMMMLIERESF